MSFVASTTFAGVSKLAAPRSSSGPHLEGHRCSFGGGIHPSPASAVEKPAQERTLTNHASATTAPAHNTLLVAMAYSLFPDEIHLAVTTPDSMWSYPRWKA